MGKAKRIRKNRRKRTSVREKMWVTEFFLDDHLDPLEFELAFGICFPGAEAKIQNVLPDAKPGYLIYQLEMPYARKAELEPFLDEYARTHNADNEQEVSQTYPFSPDA